MKTRTLPFGRPWLDGLLFASALVLPPVLASLLLPHSPWRGPAAALLGFAGALVYGVAAFRAPPRAQRPLARALLLAALYALALWWALGR